MALTGSWARKKIHAAEEQLEKWQKDYHLAQNVWDLEDVYFDILRWVDALFERDVKVNLWASETGDAKALENWDKSFDESCEALISLIAAFKKAAQKSKFEQYSGVKIDLNRLEQKEKRLWAAYRPDDKYLERGEIDGAIREAERECASGKHKTDRI